MQKIELKYGCNPNQFPAKIYTTSKELPIKIINGMPGYINLLDALNGWQLVKELKIATKYAAAASFKHVSPAGASIAIPLDEKLKQSYFVKEDSLSDIATAYIKARGTDRMSSFGDFIALSDECDESTALIISKEVSDGIIAPNYSDKALEILTKKKNGNYIIITIEPLYEPSEIEYRQVYGITFEQRRNDVEISNSILKNIPTKNINIPDNAKRDLLISLITLKYTQSNSVCYVKDGQTIGVGAGQQSRIHCTRLAGNKADIWFLRQHPKTLSLPFKQGIKRVDRDNAIDLYVTNNDSIFEDENWKSIFTDKPIPLTNEEKTEWLKEQNSVSLGSDAYFPFGDNIERAQKSGVEYIAQPGGSIRDDQVINICDKYGIVMAFTGIRLFHH